VSEETEREQKQAMAAMRSKRDNKVVQQKLDALTKAAGTTQNLMPFILDCARSYCTLYEIRASMEKVFGAYREPVFF
jgi:methylmalonyl-CoA mutase N-terminal domain/subunit